MGITLKAARVNLGYTQKEVSEKLGVSKDTLSSWERGKSFPNAMYIEKIMELYNANYDDIVFCPKIPIKTELTESYENSA